MIASKKSLPKAFLLFLIVPLLSACAEFMDIFQQANTAEHAEAIFKQQNALTSRIMMLSEADLPEAELTKIQQAEAKMREDCKLLNEYASRELDKENIDIWFKKRVKDSIPACSETIQNVESLLDSSEIDE